MSMRIKHKIESICTVYIIVYVYINYVYKYKKSKIIYTKPFSFELVYLCHEFYLEIEINTKINKTLFKCLSNQTRSQRNLTVKQLNGRTVEQRCIQHQSELFQFLNEFCISFSSSFEGNI
ncbi:hypothetical protein BpHYR1_017018 [Brachionus plicatilis]|uniref:Transmembrane protein n=1 Tax=Brachionus plicatilis TaxID=10195 RepID=A0A3M7RPY3_BRAPC|nr:hypothetical protein BpHYR1_017018 [Brachionus plicatilis]